MWFQAPIIWLRLVDRKSLVAVSRCSLFTRADAIYKQTSRWTLHETSQEYQEFIEWLSFFFCNSRFMPRLKSSFWKIYSQIRWDGISSHGASIYNDLLLLLSSRNYVDSAFNVNCRRRALRKIQGQEVSHAFCWMHIRSYVLQRRPWGRLCPRSNPSPCRALQG